MKAQIWQGVKERHWTFLAVAGPSISTMAGDAMLWRGLTRMKQVVASRAPPMSQAAGNLGHTAGATAVTRVSRTRVTKHVT